MRATNLLNIELHKLIGKNFRDVVPEMEKLLTTSMQNSTGISHGEINHIKDDNSDRFELVVKRGSIYEFQLTGTTINLKREEKAIKIKSLIRTNGEFNLPQIKKIFSYGHCFIHYTNNHYYRIMR